MLITRVIRKGLLFCISKGLLFLVVGSEQTAFLLLLRVAVRQHSKIIFVWSGAELILLKKM